MSGRVRAYLGVSLDGCIADPGDELGWLAVDRGRDLPPPRAHDEALSYEAFMADVGALLMGRRTFDVVVGFDGWPYGEVPVLVATTRPLDPPVPTVRPVRGTPDELVADARAASGARDVYADGGRLVSALLDAGLLDELTTTILPTLRSDGVPLFDGLAAPHELELVRVAVHAGTAAQLTWVPRAGTA